MTLSYMEHTGVIGKVNLCELQQVSDCNKRNLPIYYELDELVNMLFYGDFYIITCKVNNIVVGYAIFYNKINHEYHLFSIALDEEYRKCGYGSKMIDYIKIIDNKITDLYLKVSINNTNAINCYKNNNFVIIELKNNYYNKPMYDSRDAYIMKKTYLS